MEIVSHYWSWTKYSWIIFFLAKQVVSLSPFYITLYIEKSRNIFTCDRAVTDFGRQNIVNSRKTLLSQTILNCLASCRHLQLAFVRNVLFCHANNSRKRSIIVFSASIKTWHPETTVSFEICQCFGSDLDLFN